MASSVELTINTMIPLLQTNFTTKYYIQIENTTKVVFELQHRENSPQSANILLQIELPQQLIKKCNIHDKTCKKKGKYCLKNWTK